jgi:hypothetical protein
MDVAAEVLFHPEPPSHGHELFHGVVGSLDDARAEEKPFDIVPAVELQREADDFIRRETGARHPARPAVDAVAAVVDAVIGEQQLEQGNAAPVGGIAVADPGALGASDASPPSPSPCRAAAGAGGIVLGGIRQNREFALELHHAAGLKSDRTYTESREAGKTP